jgi:hypothetical protein
MRGEARPGSRRWLGAATTLAAWIGVALMPKCPLCIAVVLSGLGVGAAWVPALSPYARSGLWGFAVMALFFTLYAERRRLRGLRAGDGGQARVCSCDASGASPRSGGGAVAKRAAGARPPLRSEPAFARE